MSHLKKDFKRHKLFNNKYANQSMVAYLCRGNVKYIPRSDDFIPSFVIATLDFVIRCNNHICRRGEEKNAIINVRNEYDKKGVYFGVIWVSPIRKYYDVTIQEKNDYETTHIIKSILDKIKYWDDKFENDWDGFKDFIFDTIEFINKNNYTWVFADGEDIIYDRSIRDKEEKRLYCTLNNDKVIKRFKDEYFANVYVESKDKARLYNQISYMLITISDVNNYIVSKDYTQAIELLEDYFNDNNKMDSCKDIYYLLVFNQFHEVYVLLKQNKNADAYNLIKKIVSKENSKYTSLILFESVAIDLSDNTYAKIVNL